MTHQKNPKGCYFFVSNLGNITSTPKRCVQALQRFLQGERTTEYVLKKDVWQFNVGKGKPTTKVCVHLDLAEEPTQDVIVKDLVRYISLMEEIHKNCA